MAYGTSSWTIFMDWYESISSDAVVRSGGHVDGVMMYRDIELAIDHAPEVAAPWALMVQYLLPFEADTAKDIWDGFTRRFIVEGRSGAHIEVVPGSGIEDIRTTCLATWLAAEVGDDRHHDALLNWVNGSYQPRLKEGTGEFAYWFHLDEPHPRGQWNNAIMNTFVAPPGTWTSILNSAP
jgi:hypothetical protein